MEFYMNNFRNFMYGRYGIDRLTQVLIGLTCGLTFIGTILHSGVLVTLSYVPLLYAIYRTMSKDIQKRTNENRKFMEMIQKLLGKWTGSKTHRIYNCPSCKQTIRVPKGKGKIMITCPKCKTEFIKRT
jgi:hypothetical protein